MEGLGEIHLTTLELFGLTIPYNPINILMTFIVFAFILLFALYVRKNLKLIPGMGQSIFEMIYDFLSDITLGTLGEKDGKYHLPFIVTLFIFILTANWIGVLPNVFKILGTFTAFLIAPFSSSISVNFESLFNIVVSIPSTSWLSYVVNFPAFTEPTRSVNTDLALALLVFILVQAYGIKNKGVVGFLRSFFDDPFPMKGWRALFFFVNPFFYLNIIGAVANVVSHSFRLFGNMFGGGMIIVIVSKFEFTGNFFYLLHLIFFVV